MNIIKLASAKSRIQKLRVQRLNPIVSDRLFATDITQNSALKTDPDKVKESLRKNILEKTQKSYKAMEAGEGQEYDKQGYLYNRKQAYDHFIDRMFEIYRTEERYLNKLEKERNYNLAFQEIFQYDRLVDAKRARGHIAQNFHDYSVNQLFDSSTFVSSVEELEYKLEPGNLITPHQIADNIANLAQLGYKKTSLVRKVNEKLSRMLEGKDVKPEKEFDIYDPIYGDKEGRFARYNLYSGFKDSKEFYTHVETLLNWKTEEESFTQAREQVEAIEGSDKQTYTEILEIMKKIIEAGKDVKSIQAELAEAIEAVRSQYSQLASAFDHTEFLNENRYLKYDLLELQERLVEAGIMSPDEATGIVAYEKMPFTEKMARAKELFYDLTQDYYPEMIPITDHLLDPVNTTTVREGISLFEKESHNQLNLKYIGLIFGRLSEMRESIKRDDVPINDYFAEKCHPKEFVEDPAAPVNNPNVEQMHKYYTMFWKEVTETFNILLPEVRRVLSSDEPVELDQLFHLCFGIYGGEVIDPEITEKIEQKVLQALELDVPQLIKEDLIIGTQGLANSLISYETQEKAFSKIKDQVDAIDIEDLNLNEKLRLAWGLTVLEQFDSKILQQIAEDLEPMPFEKAQNELTYEEFKLLRDIYYGLEHLNTDPALKIKSQNIRAFASNSQDLLKDYPEEAKKIDPFRKKIFDGVTMCLSKLGMNKLQDAQGIQFQTESEAGNVNKYQYPYKPDLLFSHRDKTIALWLNNRSKYTSNSGEQIRNLSGSMYTGSQRYHEKVLRALNPDRDIKNSYICIEDMVDYDLENLQASLNTDSLSKLDFLQHDAKNLYYEDLAKLSNWYIESAPLRKSLSPPTTRENKADEDFVDALLEFFELRHSNMGRSLVANTSYYENLKTALMKIHLLSESLSEGTRQEVESYIQKLEHSDLEGLLLKIKDTLHDEMPKRTQKVDEQLDTSWIGVRYGIEVPNSQITKQKDLGVEVLDRNFMWCDDYFHYDDWKQLMKDSYDGFNLNVKTPKDLRGDEKFYFQDGWRRNPSGIFPDGKGNRDVSMPNFSKDVKKTFLSKLDLIKHKNFDGDLSATQENKPMIVEEVLRQRNAVTPEIRMITNLQNIKNTLKKTHSDQEILNFLSSLTFTDDLIKSHLNSHKAAENLKPNPKTRFLPRNAKKYRQFLQTKDNIRDRYDPYTNFFLKEAGYQDYTRNVLPEKIRKASSPEEKEFYQEILDSVLLTELAADKSQLNIGTYVHKKYKAKFNYDSLIVDQNNYARDPEAYDSNVSDELFLERQRARAESNLIKVTIMNKLHQQQDLTQNEQEYLKAWNQEIYSGKFQDLSNCMVPLNFSTESLRSLPSSDVEKLNSLELVDINGLEDFAVNDLALELNHFIDSETVQNLQKEIKVENLKELWDISEEHKFIEKRNKEIDLVLGELEEKAYRYGGKFSDQEIEGMRRMYNIKRGQGIFDEAWQPIDNKEFDDLDFNNFDDRFEILERWFEKKEREIKTRIYLPREELKSNYYYAEKLRDKTVELMMKIFQKPYGDITQSDLNEFINGLCSRMMLFNGEFPKFLPYVIKEVVNHPNISVIDKEQLESYSDMFDIDWRDDISKPLLASPIYTKDSRKVEDDLNVKSISEKMRNANIPYLEDLKKRVMEHK